ncbi:acyl-CoA synthetase [Halovulum dunhuangense]|uniref:acyl-CoA synthetase n=1 Tax=Halovulum dunhuangense TaxID=1505036 RepID=UPI003CCE4D53
MEVATRADVRAIETSQPLAECWTARSLYEMLSQTADRFPDRPALSFQLKSGPRDKAETLTWRELREQVTRAANLFRRLGIGDTDVIAYVLPNCTDAVVTLLAGATAGIVNPINPLLDERQIAGILHETGARAVVTLAPFPKTDLNEKVGRAIAHAPNVEVVLEIDLARHLGFPESWIVPFIRPRHRRTHKANVVEFRASLRGERASELAFAEPLDDRVCAYFHTGGTTGEPKIVQHRASGILYNGWCGATYMFNERDVLICPLPMFHVLAAYPVLMSCLMSGAHFVLPTPQGFRGAGVLKNFWKLVERYRVTFMVMVPTAAAALMNRPVDADISTLRFAICGSAALPPELFRRFEAAVDLRICEGYGLTEATCLVAINPPHGERRIGSVGFPFPHTDIRICICDEDGTILRDCAVDEAGEICVAGPGVEAGAAYTDPDRNRGLFAGGTHLRTGDLGRIDADGYIWITGRAKDIIIRGGHNIDPAVIENALMAHPDVRFVGAVGQPDASSGEVPVAYVELHEGAAVTDKDLLAHARDNIGERAAQPRQVEIVAELPKTAVGKVHKPELRKQAIARVYGDTLRRAGLPVSVAAVVEDRKLGLVAALSREGEASDADVDEALASLNRPWRWVE